METTTTVTRADHKTGHISADKARSINDLHKIGTIVIGSTSLFFGAWAVTCMASGLIAAGGPAGLVVQYVKAVM